MSEQNTSRSVQKRLAIQRALRLSLPRIVTKDPAADGPEVAVIRFFRIHPDGWRGGIALCGHTELPPCVSR